MCFQGKVELLRKKQRLLGWITWLLVASFVGCFKDIEAPPCHTLAQCPATERFYNVCEDGYCFFSDSCKDSTPVAQDMCCPDFEGDRTRDIDCVSDVLLSGELSTPAMFGSNIVVSANVLKGGNLVVVLYLLSPQLEVLQEVEVGKWDKVLPVVVSRAGLVYVAYSQGVKAFAYGSPNHLEMKKAILGYAPEANMVATDTSMILWAVSPQSVMLYNEDSGEKKIVQAEEPPEGGEVVLSTTATSSHAAMVTSLGNVKILEIETLRLFNLEGVSKAVYVLPYDQTLYVFSTSGRVSAFELTSGSKRYEESLEGEVLSNPVIDQSGNLFIATTKGISKVRGGEKIGETLETLSCPCYLYITSKGRLILATKNKIVSFVLQDGYLQNQYFFVKGLWFSLPVETTLVPTLFFNRIMVPLKSGHLLLYLFGESLEERGFAAPYSDHRNSAFVKSLEE